MPIIIDRLSYTYDPKAPFKKVALSNISLKINDGDFLGIIGHTGSGKSTLIGHLNGLIKVTEGSITVDGIDLTKKYDYKRLRSTVGMLFQYPEHQLFDETVRRDVGFGPRNMGLAADEIDARVKNAIELVGLDYAKIAERSPFELSGGQMRRVALAGVLAMKPKVLVLDEPTAGLDPQGKEQILALIQRIRSECPTIIMISHNMDEIFENCNRIALLSEGRLKGVFTPQELYKNSALIKENGLEMPTVFMIADELNRRGFNIENIKNTADLVEQISQQITKRGLTQAFGQDFQPELIGDLKQSTQRDSQPELKGDLKQSSQQDSQSELKGDLKQSTQQDSQPESKGDLKQISQHDSHQALKQSTQPELQKNSGQIPQTDKNGGRRDNDA